MLGMVHPRLRTAALPAELLNKRGRVVEVRIGGVIEPSRIQALPDDEAVINISVFARTFLRGEAGGRLLSRLKRARSRTQPPPKIYPGRSRDCRRSACWKTAVTQCLSCGSTPDTLVLHEIGRLRELTFRAAGEGSGRLADPLAPTTSRFRSTRNSLRA